MNFLILPEMPLMGLCLRELDSPEVLLGLRVCRDFKGHLRYPSSVFLLGLNHYPSPPLTTTKYTHFHCVKPFGDS